MSSSQMFAFIHIVGLKVKSEIFVKHNRIGIYIIPQEDSGLKGVHI